MKTLLLVAALVVTSLSLRSEEMYRQFQPETTTRKLESTEWSIAYSFDSNNTTKPRILTIGDSICNGNHGLLRNKLAEKFTFSFWATSKCVTDKLFFKELDLVLDANPASVIVFNNGLHSLGTNRDEWKFAFAQALKFIKAKKPQAKLIVLESTPVANQANNEKVMEINKLTNQISKQEAVPVIPFFDVVTALGPDNLWSDGVHFTEQARQKMTDYLANSLLK